MTLTIPTSDFEGMSVGEFDTRTLLRNAVDASLQTGGGVAISCLMGCRGVAVLPEGMSRERFFNAQP